MEKLVINGSTSLKGEVTISGAKNAAVAILPAALLINGKCTIENLPNISDVKISCDILSKLGAKIEWVDAHTITIDTTDVCNHKAPVDMTSKFRASYYLIGSLLSRCHDVEVGLPGGCNLGARPIDQHIKGFEALGANVTVSNGKVQATTDKLIGTSIYLDMVSVGATINVMLAAVLAEGTTTIDNAAKEPHVVDVANFLNTMGADIRGAGTDVIKINGVKELKGGSTYSIVPDQIEAGTFMLAAVASKGDILIKNCITKHLECLTAKILEIGGNVEEDGDNIRVWCTSRPQKANIKTLPYPGFPTDLQPQMGVVLSIANGTSTIIEDIFEARYSNVAELNRMGASIHVEGKAAIIQGVKKLHGTDVTAFDLRGGAGMCLAGLVADGITRVHDIHFIERGYEDIVYDLNCLGARATRIEEA